MMNKFLNDLDALLVRFGVEGVSFSEASPLVLLAFILSMLGFFLGFFAYLKASNSKKKAEAPSNASTRLDELNVVVDDLRNLRSDFENRLSRLEGKSEGFEKKKPELKDSESLPPKASLDAGLTKTRDSFVGRLKSLFGASSSIDASTLEGLEELLVSSDIGVGTTSLLLDELKSKSVADRLSSDEAISILKERIQSILHHENSSSLESEKIDGKPRVILFVGVNGVGKTTTIGKISEQFKNRGAKVVLGACDTFRAAAVEQLKIWSERSGVDIVSGEEGAKPTTVAYQTIHKALGENYDVALIDTAGRLHTRKNLMSELMAIKSIIERELPGAPHDIVLVVDATTGQNALQQARQFHEAVELSGVVVTKLDGTPKGGITVAIRQELGIPIRYIGVGEGLHDLQAFNASSFCNSLFDTDASEGTAAQAAPVRGRARRTRRA